MVRGGRNLILPLVLVSLVPFIYNLTGTKAKGAEAAVYVVHSLGNSDELSVLAHGLPDAVIVLLAMVILRYCAHSNRAVAAELNPRRGTKRSVIDYTVIIRRRIRRGGGVCALGAVVDAPRGEPLWSSGHSMVSLSATR